MPSKRTIKPSYKAKQSSDAAPKPKTKVHKRQVSCHEEDSAESSDVPRGRSQKRSKRETLPEEVSDHEDNRDEVEVVDSPSEEEVSTQMPPKDVYHDLQLI
jgi:hypothetical protein